MKRARLAVVIIVGITILAVLASLFIPAPPGNNSAEFSFNLAVSLATMLLYVGGAVVTIMGFGAFTSKLRRAYAIIFTGLSFWALGYLQLPIMIFFGLIKSDIAISISVIPFILAAMLIFVGTRKLAGLFGVKNIATSWWFALGFVAIIAALTAAWPHPPNGSNSELEFDLSNMLIMIAVTFFGLGAYHILLVKRRASVAFANAFAWLFISMIVLSVFAGLGSTLAALSLGANSGQIVIVVAIVPSCVAALLFLRSAYGFNEVVEMGDTQGPTVARDFFGKPLKPRKHDAATSLDIVAYAASLASNPSGIESAMNDLRTVTLHVKPGGKPDEHDEKVLVGVYVQIENYLLEQEQLRVFTKETLHQDIAQRLRLTPEMTDTFLKRLVQRPVADQQGVSAA